MTTVASTSTSNSSSGSNSSLDSLTSNYTMFLKLLTTQMQNQDPLNPMDTAQYTQQLVQYSQVEQAIKQSSTLNDILSSISSQGMSQASSYIGREARFDTNVAGLTSDTPATWTYASNTTPDTLTATIKDAKGNTVRTVKLDAKSQGRFSWDGTEDDGSKAPDGAYSLSLSAKTANGTAMDVTINSVGIVKEVVTDGSTVMLGVNGLRLSSSGLVAVADASKASSNTEAG
jgi:flagellar basal-body rod modification protein FlgD